MKLTNASRNVLVPGVPVCLAILVAVQHEALLQVTSEHQILEQQLHQMDDVAARNAQLSNLVAQASNPEPLPRDQMLELLRLRGQVSALKRQQIELDRARAENQQAHAALDGYLNTATNRTAMADYWPRDSWTNSGYGNPDAALQTVLWAGYNGDMTNFLASIAGKALEDFGQQYKGNSEAEISARVMEDTYSLKSARILSREVLDDDTVLLNVELEHQNSSRTIPMLMKKIDGEWKFTGPQH